MKKLLLIALLFFITPDAKADMDNICKVPPVANWSRIQAYIEMYDCERNNILVVSYGADWYRDNLQNAIARYCRYDRNVVQTKVGFTCVLYDNKPRNLLKRVK